MNVTVKENFECPYSRCSMQYFEGEEIQVTREGKHYCECCDKPIYLELDYEEKTVIF